MNDLLYQIALTLVPDIGLIRSKILVEHFDNAENIFKAKKKELSVIENIGVAAATKIKSFEDFSDAEKEIRFIEKYKIQPIINDLPEVDI